MKKLLVLLLVLGLAAPAMAAEWNFYGSARVATFWGNYDSADGEDLGTPIYDDAGVIDYSLQGNARIGANVKVNDQIGGNFEYGTGVNVRKLYGTYNFGAGNLLVGQTYTPTSNYFYSNQVGGQDADLLGWGQFYLGRKPMIQLTVGGFKVALVQPTVGTGSLTGDFVYNDADVWLPKIELAYNFKSSAFFFDVYGGFQTYSLENQAEEESVTVNSYVLGAGAGVTFGPVTIAGGASYTQNPTSYGASVGGLTGFTTPFSSPTLDGDEIENANMIQAHLVATFVVNQMLTFEVGGGWIRLANPDYADRVDSDDDAATGYALYGNATVTIVPGFFVVPEVGYYKVNEFNDFDPGSLIYYGLKWQINF